MGAVTHIRSHETVAYNPGQLALIKRTVAADCNDDEFSLFIEVARRVRLDPFRKQIYAVVYNKDRSEKRKMSIITGIDGYRAVAARNNDYRPDDEPPVLDFDEAAKSPTNPSGLRSATVKCWKLGPDGKWYAVVAVAFWEEYAPLREIWKPGADGKRHPSGEFELDKTSNWYRMPRVMLPKCAEANALRKGWPEDLSGLYVAEEMEQARFADLNATQAVQEFEKEQRLRLTNSKDSIFIQWAPDSALEAVPMGQFADRAAAFISSCASLPDLVGWEETNRVGLQDFWARSKSDALELKKVLEGRKAAIAEANRA